MASQPVPVQHIADQVSGALAAGDLAGYAHLLDPHVHWGPPDDPSFGCQTRAEVLSWYRQAKDAGMRAEVTETLVCGDRILVGLKVTGNEAAAQAGGEATRWQVLTVRDGLVVDIAGYDSRGEAAASAGLAPPADASA